MIHGKYFYSQSGRKPDEIKNYWKLGWDLILADKAKMRYTRPAVEMSPTTKSLF